MKKTWKILLSLLFLLLLVFLLPGMINKEVTFHTKLKINKPLSSVYITMGDPGRLSHWMTGFKKIEHLQGMPFCEGSKYRLTFSDGDHTYTIIEEIIKITWKKRLVVDMHADEMDIRMDLFFFRMDDLTMIEGTYTLKPNTFWMRILLPWVKPAIKKRIEEEFGYFKKMMEETNVSYNQS